MIVEHLTGGGKSIRGVVRTDLTEPQARASDPYTFRKDGGWFIREKHIGRAVAAPPIDGPVPSGLARTETATDERSGLLIDVVLSPKVSFASHQCAVPILRELTLVNAGSAPLEHLTLDIESEPPVFARREWRIDRVPPGGEARVSQRDLRLNAGMLLELTEAVRCDVTVRACGADGGLIAERRVPVEVLARFEWGGSAAMPELLAAFVLPNDPAVSRLLKSASEALRGAGKPDGIDGYQSGQRTRVYELASAIWTAVATLRLTYAEPPKSFELQGQKIRTPSTAFATGLATCLDTALLFASALEQAGLYPILVLVRGHAFAGLWLQPQEFAALLVEDAATLRKRIALNELVVFETTCATGAAPAGFAHAIKEAERRIDEEREREFVLALDVRRARMQRIRPLALIEAGEASGTAPGEETSPSRSAAMETAPPLPDFDLAEQEARPSTPEGRLNRWQRKLLDLTTRNRLLNVKPGPGAVRLLCPDAARVEDDLAAGKSFRIVPAPSFEGAAGRDAELHAARTGEMPDEAYAREALERGEILSPNSKDRLEAQLVELYRKARLDLAEGGANTLHLALGFLLWRKSGSDGRVFRAPLILIPVRLDRRSARAGVRLTHREDEPRFNLTLLQMLRQDFELHMPELAGALPTDASGIDVKRVWDVVRRAVRDAAGFEVSAEVMLGAFSFAKYLMWKDLVDRTDVLKRNPVVRHLLESPREPYPANGTPPKPEAMDLEVSPADLFMPLPADSSQVAAVVGSARGCDFVLDGPPGTGKSQTIANMIAHNLALGRTVLFVAEKRAALDVVQRRLQAHGLGPFCLELHSNKAVKQDVLRQLDAAWSAATSFPEGEWSRVASELKTSRDGLNRLVAALHRVQGNGITLFEAIGRVVHDGVDKAIRLGWPAGLEHDAAQLHTLREAARRLDLQRAAGLAGRGTALTAVGRTEWSNAWQAELLAAALALGSAARDAAAARDAWEASLQVPLDRSRRGLAKLAALAHALAGAHGLDLAFAFAPEATRAIEQAKAAVPVIASYRAKAAALSAPLAARAVRSVPVAALEAEWTAASAAIWPWSKKRKAAVAKRLNPEGDCDPETDLPVVRSLQALLAQLDQCALSAAIVPGWADADTDVARLDRTLEAAAALRLAVADAADTPEQLVALRAAARALCADGNDLLSPSAAFGRAGAALVAALGRFDGALAGFERTAGSPSALDAPDLLAETQTVAAALRDRAAELNPWCAWCRARDAARDLGLASLIEAIETDRLPAGGASEAFDLAYALWWAGAAIDADPAAREFNLLDHADSIDRFRALDRKLTEMTQLAIRARLSGALPSREAQRQPPGFSALAHQLKLKQSRKPLRELIGEMGPALRTLSPCLLMSPLSIAQYLPPETATFDLVIFDEASQITPWDAVGAIARGRQVVVAGDPKQMPPTSFFAKSANADGADEDEQTGEDQESILDECLAARLPERRLTWHYRSRHESLIAFSNHQYYDSDLLTFPAPVTRETAVSLRQVEGAWSRGQDRTNRIEAEAIAEEAVRRLLSPDFVDERGDRLTLAVITLNAEQQRLVEDLLDRARHGRPELEPFFAEEAVEPVIVRNLETVQGDERDLILLGIGYGPETPGAPAMAMNFGPLNREGGWRRLNVAITRARREMVIFASFPASMIDLNRTGARAVRDLKHFLEYAERGPRVLGEAVAASGCAPASPFEQAVARGLSERGWSVAPQVGVSRFRIDIGVVHPDRPADFLMGLECDGAGYRAAATARDRDKVRDEVLTGLGWSLARTWSVEWWINPLAALDRLDAVLKDALAASRSKAVAEAEEATRRQEAPAAEKGPTPPDAQRDTQEPDGDPAVAATPDTEAVEPGGEYRATRFDDMSMRIDAALFSQPAYTPVLREMVQRVIDAEAPVRDDLLVERIARAHGFKRSGRLIRDRLLSLARGMAHVEAEPGGGGFIWPAADAPQRWDRARYPASTDDIRALEDIALPELSAALKSNGSEDPLSDAARRFGIRRVTATARERLKRSMPPRGHLTE